MAQARDKAHRLRRAAFSLLELSVVILIIGVISGVALSLKQSGAEDCVVATKAQLAQVDEAVRAYVTTHDKFPRPAIRTAGVEDTQYGREASAASLDSNGGVLFGALPFQSLGLAPSYAGDCWGNKFTYAVTEDLTDSVKFNATSPGPVFEGNITIKSSSTSTVSSTMAYAVISHGLNASGAVKVNYRDPSNSNRRWCGVSSAIESENCDVSNSALVAAAFNDGKDAGNNLFDDVISFGGKTQRIVNGACAPDSGNCSSGVVTAFTPGACDTSDTWTCAGQHGGTDAACSAASAPCAVPENGACGTNFNTCSNATPAPASPVVGSCGGVDTWTCLGNNGGANALCGSPNLTPCSVDGGWSNCSASCGGGTRSCTNPAPSNGGLNCIGSTDCNMQPCSTVVHGACGGASNSCNSGTPVGFAAGNCSTNSTWTCQGANGGSNASCSIGGRCDGQCDNTTIDSCAAGIATAQNPGVCGTIASWTCAGTNGGDSIGCSKANSPCTSINCLYLVDFFAPAGTASGLPDCPATLPPACPGNLSIKNVCRTPNPVAHLCGLGGFGGGGFGLGGGSGPNCPPHLPLDCLCFST